MATPPDMGMLTRVAQSAVNAAWALAYRPSSVEKQSGTLSSINANRGGWFSLIHEPFAGAWQRNIAVRPDTVASFSAAYACITLIMSDIGKLRLRLVQEDAPNLWSETTNPAYSPVLRRPNRYQNRLQFIENWLASKLLHGNAYVFKVRDNRNVVTAMYLLDPCRTTPLIADDGSIFYEIHRDNLTGLQQETIVVPQSEIIHDRMNTLWHPLVGVSPIMACGIAAQHGLNIQRNGTAFFSNFARPAGILTTATPINDEKAKEYQDKWNNQYREGGLGGTAILGGGWTFTPMTMSAADSQMIEQLKMTIEIVCSCFKVPTYMIGAGPAPTYNNIEAINQQYYSQCLQIHTEEIEAVLDDGLGLGPPHNKYGTEFDIDDLLRMDTATRVDVAQKSIMGGGLSPNEVRERYHGLGPVKGGESPYLQQQQFSLSALSERDRDKPFAKPTAPPPATPATPAAPNTEVEDADGGEEQRRALTKHFSSQIYHSAAQHDARDAA